MKIYFLILLFIIFILNSCIYDPPAGIIKIKNESNSIVYVYFTCTGSLSPDLPLKVYFPKAATSLNPSIDSEQINAIPKLRSPIVKPQTNQDSILANAVEYFPYNRIKAKSKRAIAIGGSPGNPDFGCKNDQINIFFITEKTLQHNSWAKICQKSLYKKKKILTSKQLEADNWEVVFSSK